MSYSTLNHKSRCCLNKKEIYFIFFAIIAIFLFNAMPISVLSPILIILIGLAIGIAIIYIFAYGDASYLLNIFLIGFSLRIFVSFLCYIISFLIPNWTPGFLFSNDGWLYSDQGWQICKFAERGIKISAEQVLNNPNLKIQSGNITSYDYFASHVYSITGYSPLSLLFISSLAGSIAALFVYLIARELFSKRVARLSAIFAFFWPSFIMWSTQNLKEPMIAMFILIFLWTIFYIHRHFAYVFLALSIVSILVLLKIGQPFLIMIAAAFFFSGLFLFSNHLFKNKLVAGLVIVIALIIGIAFFKNAILSLFHLNIQNYKTIFEFIDYSRDVRAYGRLQFLKGFDISTLPRVLSFLPFGLFYAFFAPFPWQLGSAAQIMAVPETIVFYLLLPYTVIGIAFGYKRRFNQSLLLLSVITAVMLLLALLDSNSGTLFRHRSVVFYLLFIFTAIGISLKSNKRFFIRRC